MSESKEAGYAPLILECGDVSRFEELAGQPVDRFLAEEAERQDAQEHEEEGNELLPESATGQLYPTTSSPPVVRFS